MLQVRIDGNDVLIARIDELLRFHWENPPASAIPKAQIIQSLEGLITPELEKTVRLFLTDSDNDVRLSAIEYLLRCPEETAREAILECYLDSQDRPRIQHQILEYLAEKGWTVKGFRPAMEASLPQGYTFTTEGKVRRVGG